MVCLLPLLAVGSPLKLWGVHIPFGKRGRTWLILFGAALAGGFFDAGNIMAFAAIDAVAVYLVLKRPRGEAQKAIGLIFAMMLCVHIGFYVACHMQPGPHDVEGYAAYNRLLGWLQWAFLFSWGASSAVVRFVRNRRASGGVLVSGDGV